MKRAIMYWALAGAFVPVAIIIVSQIQGGVFEWPRLAATLWPSWILMGATYEREFTAFGILVLTISITLNVILYSVVGIMWWFVYDRFLK